MIDKVLIAEDHESANLSLQRTMADFHVKHVDHAFYCDEALRKIGLAKGKQDPYDLLITDLYFEPDGIAQRIAGGFELIQSVREIQPDIMILVFSSENRPATIDMLYKNYHVDAYVRKARNDAKELKAAFEVLSRGQRYQPRSLSDSIRRSNAYEFTDFDINIIRLLSSGYQQNEIPVYLKQHGIKPSSLSTIEKRLNQIREELGFSKNEQLVLFCKEAGIF